MSITTCQIEIDRPVAEVFAWLDTDEKALQWVTGLEQIVPITEGGNRVGAEAKHVYVENGRRVEMTEETLAYEPNRHVKIRGTSDAFTMTAEYTLTPRGDATMLELSSGMNFTSGPMRLLTPLLALGAKKRLMTELHKLKALVESS